MSASANTSHGLFGRLRSLFDTGLGLAQNRFELFVVEYQEEKLRVTELIMLVCALVAAGMITMLIVIFAGVMIFWENGRLPALGMLVLLYATTTLWLWRLVRNRVGHAPKPFGATLAELEKDKQCLHTN